MDNIYADVIEIDNYEEKNFNELVQEISEYFDSLEIILKCTKKDPLSLSPLKIKEILTKLRALSNVGIIKIETNALKDNANNINFEIANIIREFSPIYLGLNFSNRENISTETLLSCENFINDGVPIGAELKIEFDVEDNIEDIKNLMNILEKSRIIPEHINLKCVKEKEKELDDFFMKYDLVPKSK